MSRFVWTALALFVFVAPARLNCFAVAIGIVATPVRPRAFPNVGTTLVAPAAEAAAANSMPAIAAIKAVWFGQDSSIAATIAVITAYPHAATPAVAAAVARCTPALVALRWLRHNRRRCDSGDGSCGQAEMPSGAMMTPMQPIIQASATMAPPVAGTRTEGAGTTTAPVATMAPVMMTGNNCCCDNSMSMNNNYRGGMFRRGWLRR